MTGLPGLAGARPAVATALRVEQLALAGALPGVPRVRTGMGPVRARRRAGRAAARTPPVLLAGLAGGLAPQVRPGDVVVATQVVQGGVSVPLPAAALLAGCLRRAGLTVHLGPVVSSAQVVSGADRARLAATGALAVDMESGPLAAHAGDRPFAVVRVVVDTADRPLLHPGTPARGLAALRTLRRTAPVLRAFLEALGPRTLVLAGPRSFCAGVERAIDIVERSLARHGAPVYVRRQVVHNAHVVQGLQDRGAVFVQELDEVPPGSRVVLAAHGVTPAVRAQAAERDLLVVDATCPLVAKVHSEVRRYAARGDTVLLIGHADHEEVVGTVGEAPAAVRVVEDAWQAARVAPPDAARVAYVMQTTLAADEAEQVAGVLRERFPTLSAPRSDDICYASTNRQAAVRAVAASCELVLVVGSANSSNSRRLVEVAEREGAVAHLVEDAAGVELGWLAGVTRIGITAGASAPPHLVEELVSALAGLGPVRVREEHVAREHLQFTLPKDV